MKISPNEIELYAQRSPVTPAEVYTYRVGEGGWLARADYLLQSTPYASEAAARQALVAYIEALNAALGYVPCEHCGDPLGVEVHLGAHGRAYLCSTCERAVLHGGACPLGDSCPEEHGAVNNPDAEASD